MKNCQSYSESEMGLKAYIIRRVIVIPIIILGVVTLIFAVLSIMTPVMRVSFYVENPHMFTQIDKLIKYYGLDQPIHIQYFKWLGDAFRGDFGICYRTGEPALQAILSRVPATFELVLFSFPLIVLFGIWMGTTAAINYGKRTDKIIRVGSVFGISLPPPFFAVIFVTVFYGILHWTTLGQVSRWDMFALRVCRGEFIQYTHIMTLDALLNGDLLLFADVIRHLIFPAMFLVFTQSPVLIRLTRSSMLESLGKNYIITARAKGLSKKETAYKHARRNALISVMTISGLLLGTMLTGLMITEVAFSYPGVGFLAAMAARTLDAATVIAYAVFTSIVFVIVNLVVDVLYAYVDPRIRIG